MSWGVFLTPFHSCICIFLWVFFWKAQRMKTESFFTIGFCPALWNNGKLPPLPRPHPDPMEEASQLEDESNLQSWALHQSSKIEVARKWILEKHHKLYSTMCEGQKHVLSERNKQIRIKWPFQKGLRVLSIYSKHVIWQQEHFGWILFENTLEKCTRTHGVISTKSAKFCHIFLHGFFVIRF